MTFTQGIIENSIMSKRHILVTPDQLLKARQLALVLKCRRNSRRNADRYYLFGRIAIVQQTLEP
jgi:hypothetical protein